MYKNVGYMLMVNCMIKLDLESAHQAGHFDI